MSGDGNRIFITGGASGLGLAIAMRYAREGWRICIGDVNDKRGAAAKKQLADLANEVFYVHCDVTREEDVQAVADKLVKRWGGVDVVVNNAGVAQAGSIDDVPQSDWEWVFNINLFGVVRGCRIFGRLLKQQGHGHIINISSMAGLLNPPMMSSYNASKAAVVALSETMRIELAGTGVGVSVVCPSFFKTNLTESMRSTDPHLIRSVNKLFERGKVSAEQIAEQIYHAQRRDRFYVLPHSEGRTAWHLKRLLPWQLYASLIIRRSRKQRSKRSSTPQPSGA